jgi:hypothetical protein
MLKVIFNNWNFMRVLRLGLGIAILVQAGTLHNWPMAVAGILFTAMPLFNLGCCGSNGCNLPAPKRETENETSYEEVV